MRRAGGQAATAAVVAARLGLRAAFIGAVGDDEDGAFALAELRRAGVDCRAVRIRPGAASQRALIIACRRSGERMIVWQKDAAIRIDPAELDYRLLAQTRCFLGDGHFLPAETAAAEFCRRHGIPTVLDLEHIAGAATRRLLRQIDHIVTPRAVPDRLRGRAFRSDRARCAWLRAEFGASCAVVTAGAAGSSGSDAAGFFHAPACRVRVVDTTGAGDVYHGAYCAALLAGLPLDKRLRFANFMAAQKCRVAGARAGIPTIAMLRGPLAAPLHRATGLIAAAVI